MLKSEAADKIGTTTAAAVVVVVVDPDVTVLLLSKIPSSTENMRFSKRLLGGK
jgi:hypothetical protein